MENYISGRVPYAIYYNVVFEKMTYPLRRGDRIKGIL